MPFTFIYFLLQRQIIKDFHKMMKQTDFGFII